MLPDCILSFDHVMFPILEFLCSFSLVSLPHAFPFVISDSPVDSADFVPAEESVQQEQGPRDPP